MSEQETWADVNAEIERCRDHLSAVVPGRDLFTRTDYGRGETDYVRVYIAPRADAIVDISYHAARVSGRRMTDRGVALRGGQYSKGLELVENIWHAIGAKSDQQHWHEIH